MSGAVHELKGNQRLAVDPQESVWLSASAGTGKTQVLSARVLRLLLQPGVDPSQILCLTFTKAGAAEMAVRINDVLARWVRLKDIDLGRELGFLGADVGPETRERARTLFASVLDSPGGGLRIDTIHAFSQWLLANFPTEAELIPGARPMEDREREALSREVLSDLVAHAERTGDAATLDAIAEFTRRKDPESLRGWLMRCASAHGMWFGTGSWQPPMRPRVLTLLGLPSDTSAAQIADLCSDDAFDVASLRRCNETLAAWSTKAGQEGSEAIGTWLALEPGRRAEGIDDLYFGLFTKTTDAPKQLNNVLKRDPDYGTYIDRVGQCIARVREYRTLLQVAEFIAPALELGRKFALAWDEAKTREGLLDFDDLIERAAALLTKQEAADWIRFKLDRQFDHILVDEAQDTNAAQWKIIDGLIDDFFSGEGASGDRLRTIFTVGDYKQAIFGFQGTSPENFEAAKARVKAAMHGAALGAMDLRRNTNPRELLELDLGQSFRTAKPVLEFVDAAIEAIGPEELGLREYHEHVGENRPGLVTLWEPVRGEQAETPADGDEGDENWLARHDRLMADRIASQVHRWVSGAEPYGLRKGEHRNARAGDIMVLVRKRKELASLIVARLHARGVPVAGVDRLRLGAPLAVKDLMAALRFAAQPLDDLNLANLLSSPLIGWGQADLLQHVPREDGKRLWDHLRKGDDPLVARTVAKLRDLLARADFDNPEALLHWMLVGPWRGRANLVARLGREANDPIDELVNAAFAYEAVHTPSLAGFIHWFDAGAGELKRDPGETPDLVRVMTVHGSKGLQAPIVILADATGKPGEGGEITLVENVTGEDGRSVPVPALKKEELAGPLALSKAEAAQAELQEHWRLLYVAMTRAEEALFIGGSLGPKEKEPHPDSWYARMAPLFGESALADDIWGGRREWGERAEPAVGAGDVQSEERVPLPQWATAPIGPEPRPPRPLAPSSAGEEQGADPPLPPDQAREAARRGVLIHRLLERLPELEPERRQNAAQAWLDRQARDLSAEQREELLARAMEVLSDPSFADVFGPDALAEVPLAARVGGEVIAGIADRLLITGSKVTVVDFKTARRPPATLEEIPETTVRQMAAYVAALEAIYPDRVVSAAVLYTQTLQVFAIPDGLIDPHKRMFAEKQESYSSPDIE